MDWGSWPYADPLWDPMQIHCGPLICTKFCNWLIYFLSTGRRPPDRPGLSKSEVTRLFNSNQEIFQWMLARYRFSNSRCALSDSSHLHLIPHVRFFTWDWFFSCIYLPDAAPWNVCIDAACFTFCFLVKVSPASSIVDWLGWYWINWDW